MKKKVKPHQYEGLEAIDWNFPNSATSNSIHNGHPYPAKFIPEIPRLLLDTLKIPKETVVFDPFCGSGTTMIEAQRAGYKSVGVDLNPIACLISSVKTKPLPDKLIEAAQTCVANARKMKAVPKPTIPAIDHWFKEDIQRMISSLIHSILKIKEKDNRDALRLCLSTILVRISKQESDTRYAAINKDITPYDAYQLFLNAVKKLTQVLPPRIIKFPDCKVINKSIFDVTENELGMPVGIVITSPPYPNAYEYWLYHKYRMWWLGFDPLMVKEKEIGARAHYFKKNFPTQDVFAEQMKNVLLLSKKCLIRKGYACIVIGRSKVHGEIIDNASIIVTEAKKLGLKLIFNKERVLAASRKSFNLSHASIKTENILIFRKG